MPSGTILVKANWHELQPGVLGLAHHEHVHPAAELLRAQRGKWPVRHHELPATPEGLGAAADRCRRFKNGDIEPDGPQRV